ncbi:MAG TPA: DinB family protein [Gemmatimonadales bacterium]|nr:DinB family protein [Gemmatimonadales bacterium]
MTEKLTALLAMEQSIERFLASLDGVTAEAYLAEPASGGWSLAQNAEHITVVVRGVERLLSTRILQQPLATDDPSRRVTDADLPRLLANRAVTIVAPESVRPKGRWTMRDEMATALRTSVAGLRAWAMATDADLRAFGAPHPIFGPLDGIQWIQFLAVHTDRHAAQAAEIRRTVTR